MTGRSPSPATSRWVGIGIPLTIFFAALVPRLVLVSYLGVEPESDYLAYHVMAKNLVEGKGLIDVFGNLAYYNPGYPIIALAPMYAMLGADPDVAQVGNAVLGAASAVLMYFIVADLLQSRAWAVVAGLLMALHVESIVYSEYLAKENLTVPLLLAAVLVALRARRSSKPVSAWLVVGGLMGAALLTGTSSVWLMPALLFVAVGRSGWAAAASRSMPALLIGMVIAVAPWVARNAVVLGAPVFSTSGGFNLYLGNNPEATGEFISISDTPMAKNWHELRRDGEVAADRGMRESAFSFMAENPIRTLQLALRKVVLLWTPPIHHLEQQGLSRPELVLRLVWFAQYLILQVGTACAIVIIVVRRQASAEILGVLASILAFTLIHAAAYVILRYRVPVMPFLMILTCFAAASATRTAAAAQS